VNDKGTGALQVYTSELDHTAGGTSPDVLMQDRLKKGRERLDNALETIALLCEPVSPPKTELEHIHYFCGNTEIAHDLKAHEPQRVALYKSTAALVRAYANIADDLIRAGYNDAKVGQIKTDLDRYLKLREIIRQASGETIDLKAYEADMRHLIDTYIEAKEPRKISNFDNIGLLELIVKSGIADAIKSLPDGIKGNPSAVAETIANNVRSKIIKEHLNDPAFYDKMSALLKEILDDLRAQRIDYEQFLKRIANVANQVQAGHADNTPEELKHSPALRALYHNLQNPDAPTANDHLADGSTAYSVSGDPALNLAKSIDAAVRKARPDAWRGVQAREQVIKGALWGVLKDESEVERIFLIVRAQREY
jgi:type I restriction enzyme R subunit